MDSIFLFGSKRPLSLVRLNMVTQGCIKIHGRRCCTNAKTMYQRRCTNGRYDWLLMVVAISVRTSYRALDSVWQSSTELEARQTRYW